MSVTSDSLSAVPLGSRPELRLAHALEVQLLHDTESRVCLAANQVSGAKRTPPYHAIHAILAALGPAVAPASGGLVHARVADSARRWLPLKRFTPRAPPLQRAHANSTLSQPCMFPHLESALLDSG
jgi:hypothetical protein